MESWHFPSVIHDHSADCNIITWFLNTREPHKSGYSYLVLQLPPDRIATAIQDHIFKTSKFVDYIVKLENIPYIIPLHLPP